MYRVWGLGLGAGGCKCGWYFRLQVQQPDHNKRTLFQLVYKGKPEPYFNWCRRENPNPKPEKKTRKERHHWATQLFGGLGVARHLGFRV